MGDKHSVCGRILIGMFHAVVDYTVCFFEVIVAHFSGKISEIILDMQSNTNINVNSSKHYKFQAGCSE